MHFLARRWLALSLPLALALSAALFTAPAGALTSTTVTLSTTASTPDTYGTSVPLTATLSISAATTGTVYFEYSTDGTTYQTISGCGSVSVTTGSPDTSTCTTTVIPVGTVDLEAYYAGDSTYEQSGSSAYPFVVNQHTSTISITNAAPTSPVAPGTSVTITATVGAGQTAGTVDFRYSLDGATYVTISGCATKSVSGTTATCTTTALPIGTEDLNASYQGDTNYSNQTSAAFAYGVKTAATVGLGASPASPVASGSTITLTATVGTGQTGTVTFKSSPDGTTYTTIGACSATAVSGTNAVCVTTTIPAGTLELEAVYNGNSNFATATSTVIAYDVTGSTAPTISLAAVPTGPVAFNTSVTFTATLGTSAQTGTVLFASSLDGATYTTISGCAAAVISATHATCTTAALPIGTRDVRATYSGNVTYSALASAALGFIVSGTTPSSVSLGASPASPVAAGTSVTMTATVGASAETGSVAFQYSTDGSTYTTLSACAAQSVSGTTATCVTTALPAGTADVRAIYNGNATFAPSTSSALAYAVAGSTASTVALAVAPSTPGAPGSTVTLTATVGSGQTGSVLFAYSTDGATFSTVATCAAVVVSGTTAVCSTTALPVGTLDVRATYLGNVTYSAATSAALPYAIQRVASTITLSASPTGRVALGTSVTLTATLGAGQTGTVTFEYTTNLVTFIYVPGCASRAPSGTTATCVTAALPRGTRAVLAVYSGDWTYSATVSGVVALAVKPTPISIRVGGFARASASLTAAQHASLRTFAAKVAAQPFSRVVVRGWTGVALSSVRARAVAAYLEGVLLGDGARVMVAVASRGSGVSGTVKVSAS